MSQKQRIAMRKQLELASQNSHERINPLSGQKQAINRTQSIASLRKRNKLLEQQRREKEWQMDFLNQVDLMDIDVDDDEEAKRVAMSKMLQQLDIDKLVDSSQFLTDIQLNKKFASRMMGKKANTAQVRSRQNLHMTNGTKAYRNDRDVYRRDYPGNTFISKHQILTEKIKKRDGKFISGALSQVSAGLLVPPSRHTTIVTSGVLSFQEY